ncbi:hypothetical protein NQ317_003116 [Molorchus minor]|uniref:phosphoserine transaminase n=1 Tax=Molorchus minor TaxID=1323400 RepID=A0ABQ9JG27_9CUCU|nr:hypothetical protein NQ317_003116 [Molorchus minor]
MGSSQSALNFGAGPAKLPSEVLYDVQQEFLSYKNTGMSLIEMSHRSKEYMEINDNAEKAVRELLKVPSNYKILFLQGGGCGTFAAIPLNLMNRTGSADYAVTGTWSAKAAKEAAKYGKYSQNLRDREVFPDESTWTLNPNASYLYYCDNETVDGVEFPKIPNSHDVPLVADMSSIRCYIWRCPKNIGPSGVVVVIVREDLLGNAMKVCPSVLDFTHVAKEKSIHNTPSTFSVYVMEKVLQWIKKNGGVAAMQTQIVPLTIGSEVGLIYHFVGGKNGNESLEAKFVEEAEKLKMYQLKGHRSVGGIRASLYNAITVSDVELLVKFMVEFQKQYGPKP